MLDPYIGKNLSVIGSFALGFFIITYASYFFLLIPVQICTHHCIRHGKLNPRISFEREDDCFKIAPRPSINFDLVPVNDFNLNGYSPVGDYAYRVDLPLTDNRDGFVEAINDLDIKSGSDGPESQLEALYQATTGVGRTVSGCSECEIFPSSIGWRSGALPIIFLATDASFHDRDMESGYPGAGWTQTVSELHAKGIKVFGLMSGGTISDVVDIANDTDGQTFTLSSDSSQIVDAAIDALTDVSSEVDIKLVTNGDFLGLVKKIDPENGYTDVAAGETRNFQVTFSRSWFDDPESTHIFSFTLVVTAEEVATIMELPVTVTIK